MGGSTRFRASEKHVEEFWAFSGGSWTSVSGKTFDFEMGFSPGVPALKRAKEKINSPPPHKCGPERRCRF